MKRIGPRGKAWLKTLQSTTGESRLGSFRREPKADSVCGGLAPGSGGARCGPASPSCTAGGQRRVEALVVVLGAGGGGLVDLREHGRHPLGRRHRRGQEANFGALLVERAVGHKPMKVGEPP